jgi:hypothetical protein
MWCSLTLTSKSPPSVLPLKHSRRFDWLFRHRDCSRRDQQVALGQVWWRRLRHDQERPAISRQNRRLHPKGANGFMMNFTIYNPIWNQNVTASPPKQAICNHPITYQLAGTFSLLPWEEVLKIGQATPFFRCFYSQRNRKGGMDRDDRIG